MASKRDVDKLADKVASSLQLNCGGPLLDMEELMYRATPVELEALRMQVLQKQTLSGFDDEGLVKRFVSATKPKGTENGSGDSQSYFNCFQNQVMLPTVVDSADQMPSDLQDDWLCIACPEGTRVLVIASHKSTRVYDLEGTWICEHDTHLPAGSPSKISEVADDNTCTILDCLYNNEQEIYYVVDVLCWKGLRYYKYETSIRMTTLMEKMKTVHSLKCISQTNPFRFYTLPMSQSCRKNDICKAITQASFELTGLLFYHKKALYLPGLSPLGVWLETSYTHDVLDIQTHKLERVSEDLAPCRKDWRRNRYEMAPEQVSSVHNSAYVIGGNKSTQKNRNQGGFSGSGHNRNFGHGGGQHLPPFPAQVYGHSTCPPFPNFDAGYVDLSHSGGYNYSGFNADYINYPQYPHQHQQHHMHPFKHNANLIYKDTKKGSHKEKVTGPFSKKVRGKKLEYPESKMCTPV